MKAPLLWFALAGAGFFALDTLQREHTGQTITITTGDVQRLQDQWALQAGTAPTQSTLDKLIEDLIHERRFALEARSLGLDQDDVIVERRLAQKMRFLTEDLADETLPSEQDLDAFFEAHRDNYHEPHRFTFRHIFFAAEGRVADAEAILQTLHQHSTSEWRTFGDPYIHGRSFEDRSADEISQLFGNTFLQQLLQQSAGDWQGPLQSDAGEHLVIIDRHERSRALSFAQARDQVLYDYQQTQRQLSFLRYQATLAKKYPAVVEQ